MLWHSFKCRKIIKQHMMACVALSMFYILYRSNITCILRYLFHVPCPTCGISRAIILMLNLEFTSSFYYHAFAVPISICTFLELHRNVFPINKRLIDIISLAVLIMNLIYYIYRLSKNLIP